MRMVLCSRASEREQLLHSSPVRPVPPVQVAVVGQRARLAAGASSFTRQSSWAWRGSAWVRLLWWITPRAAAVKTQGSTKITRAAFPKGAALFAFVRLDLPI